jgi:hypothetical protein
MLHLRHVKFEPWALHPFGGCNSLFHSKFMVALGQRQLKRVHEIMNKSSKGAPFDGQSPRSGRPVRAEIARSLPRSHRLGCGMGTPRGWSMSPTLRVRRYRLPRSAPAGLHSRGLMIATLETFRAVICHRCARPIRISQKLENRAAHRASVGKDVESQVFVLRCLACQRESVYSVNQIVDFPKVTSGLHFCTVR